MKRPKSVCLALTPTVKKAWNELLEAGCTYTGSIREGHVTVTDDETVVYMALQKGRKQPWIVSCYESERIKWTSSETNTSVDQGE